MQRLHDGEKALNIGRRNAREQLRLQHAGHPIAAVILIRIDFADFERSRRRARVIHGEQAVHHVTGDAQHQRLARGFGAHLARLELGEGGLGVRGSALDGLQQLAVGFELQLAREEVVGIGVHVPLFEDLLLFLEIEDFGLIYHFILVLGRQAADRHQRLNLFLEFLLLGVHSARSRGLVTAHVPAYGRRYASVQYWPP